MTVNLPKTIQVGLSAGNNTSSPLAAEADYGWPTAEPEIVHTNGR